VKRCLSCVSDQQLQGSGTEAQWRTAGRLGMFGHQPHAPSRHPPLERLSRHSSFMELLEGPAVAAEEIPLKWVRSGDRDLKTKIRDWFEDYFLRASSSHPGTRVFRLIHPQSVAYVLWSLAMAVFLSYIAIGVPLRIAFETEPCVISFWLEFDVLVDCFFVVDVAVTCFTCRNINGYLCDDWRKVTMFYVRGALWFDMVKSFPVSWVQIPLITLGSCDDSLSVLQLLKILKGLRVTRLVRLANVKRVVGALTLHHQVIRNPNMLRLMKLILFMLFALHCVACVWWLVKQTDPQLVIWEQEQGIEIGNDFDRYTLCFYYAVSTLTTVGYGDIRGETSSERITASACMLVGGLMFATIISHISTLSMSLVASDNAHEARKADVISFMQSRKVPVALQNRITSYFDRFNHDCLAGTEILEELPNSLKYQLVVAMATDTLTKVHIFRGLKQEVLVSIYVKLLPLRCAPGEVIVREGSASDEMYFVMMGGVILMMGDQITDELQEGDVFGEMTVLCGAKCTATVVTKDFCELYTLHRTCLKRVLGRFPGIHQELVKRAEALYSYRADLSSKFKAKNASSFPQPRLMSVAKRALRMSRQQTGCFTVVPESAPPPTHDIDSYLSSAAERVSPAQAGRGGNKVSPGPASPKADANANTNASPACLPGQPQRTEGPPPLSLPKAEGTSLLGLGAGLGRGVLLPEASQSGRGDGSGGGDGGGGRRRPSPPPCGGCVSPLRLAPLPPPLDPAALRHLPLSLDPEVSPKQTSPKVLDDRRLSTSSAATLECAPPPLLSPRALDRVMLAALSVQAATQVLQALHTLGADWASTPAASRQLKSATAQLSASTAELQALVSPSSPAVPVTPLFSPPSEPPPAALLFSGCGSSVANEEDAVSLPPVLRPPNMSPHARPLA